MSNLPTETVETHPEVDDEYEIALQDDVLDETLLEGPSNVTFSITSYGADYTVDTIIARLKSDAFFVPPFQRRFVWSQRHASRFIESLLLGLPVPGIFLYKDPATNRHSVVDGQQRLRTLQYFYSGLFGEKKFRLMGVRDEWAGKTYDELLPSERLKLDDSVVHATIFQQDEPKDTHKSLYFVFERINSGGIRLSPQEIRNCVNDGKLLEMIRDANKDENWRNLFGSTNTRLKDEELVLRFMAMIERSSEYSRPMRDFLNSFTADFQNAVPEKLAELARLFKDAAALIWKAKGKRAFRPSGALNAAVFEGVMFGLAKRLQSNQSAPNLDAVAKAYDALLARSDFLRACERATADDETVKLRQSLAVAEFASV